MRMREVVAEDIERALRHELSAKTIRRLANGTSTNPRLKTLALLDRYFDDDESFAELAEDRSESAEVQPPDLYGTWYGVTRKQADRAYQTVDLFRVRKGSPPPRVNVDVTRIFSTREPVDTGQRWSGVGVVAQSRELLLTFYSVSLDRPESNGVLAVRLHATYGELNGFYLRFAATPEATRAPTYKITFFRKSSDAVSNSGWDGVSGL